MATPNPNPAPGAPGANVRPFPGAGQPPVQKQKSARERAAKRRAAVQKNRTTNRTVNRNRTLHVHINKGGAAQVAAAGGQAAQGQGTPGGDFMSNEDIRAFSEHVRKEARNRAVERSMDAEQLQSVLKNIRDTSGSKSGSRARARRVARPLKLIAASEKFIARQAAAVYARFESEFESDLRKVGKARPQKAAQQKPFKFS